MENISFLEYFQSFEYLLKMSEHYSYKEIVYLIAQILKITPAQLEQYDIRNLLKISSPIKYQDVLHELIDHQLRYKWMYYRFADQVSRDLFFNLLRFRVLPSQKYLEQHLFDIQTYPVESAEKCREIFPVSGKEHVDAARIVEYKNHIKDQFPGIRICLNPILSDIWEIPKLIDYMHSGYQFYLRNERISERSNERSDERSGERTDFKIRNILYAVPMDETRKSPGKPAGKRVVAMAPFDRPWSNVELIKDCGLIPYLLYKRHGCHVSMAGAKGETYSYDSLIDGVQMEYLEDGSLETKRQYIEQNAKQIDVLILRGVYIHNIELAPVYKQHNPQGRIYLGLDANSSWMDLIAWEHPGMQAFMDCCDVIATSGAATARYLNKKWPWKIEHIPNGFYDFGLMDWQPSFEQKENIILTVGRLGTVQKATHILLEAFAKVSESLPDWKLRMAGSMEPDFEQYIQSCYQQYPYLKDRVEWIGVIEDRKQLALEYRRAKIFALSSIVEGGTPNVIAEALWNGCVIAVTRIDACEEATNSQKCGRIAELNDVDGLAAILIELAESKQLKKMSDEALRYGKEHFDMRRITDQLHELIFGA